jgi:hypothetical protein
VGLNFEVQILATILFSWVGVDLGFLRLSLKLLSSHACSTAMVGIDI